MLLLLLVAKKFKWMFTLPPLSNRPVPKPRPRKNTPDRSLSQQSSQGSLSSLSSTSGSPVSPTFPSDGSDFSVPVGGSKKSVGFAAELTCISEERGGEEPEDEFLRSLRSRRMAAKAGTKNVTVAATVEGALKQRDRLDKPRPHTTAHAVLHDVEPHIQSPSLSSLRQRLSPSKEDSLQPTTPSGWGEELTTPPRPSEGQTSPVPSGRSEGESDDSSSDQYSTPPTTIRHKIINHQEEEAPPTPKVAWAASASGGDSAWTTPDDRSGSEGNDHEAVLRDLQRRRRELQQQREMSGKKKDISTPTSVENKTKSGTETSVPPDSLSLASTQPSTGTSPRYIDEVGGASRQGTGDLTSGIYCSSCHNKIRLGQKYCNYCNHSVYPMNVSQAASAGRGNKPPGSVEGMDMSTPVRPKPVDQFKPDYQPDPDAPALPPTPAERRKIVNEPSDLLFDPSGLPIKAVAPEDERQPRQQPLRAHVEDTPVYGQHYDPFAHVTPTSAPGVAYSQSRRPAVSSSSGTGTNVAASYGYPPQDPMYLPELQQGYHKKLEYNSGAQGSTPSHGVAGVSVSTSSSSSSATGTSPKPVRSGLDQYSYKLESFRGHLQQKGKSDAEIERDPEYLLIVEEERHKQQLQPSPQQQERQKEYGKKAPPLDKQQPPMYSRKEKAAAAARTGKAVDVSKYERKNLIDSDSTYTSGGMENIRAMEKLKLEGQQLLEAIKVYMLKV